MNSQYAPPDSSLIFSFLSNYDRSCVYSNITDLAVPKVSLDRPISVTVFSHNGLIF